MNVLYKTKAYLAGPIQYVSDAGVTWRKELEQEFDKLGIVYFNPLEKPFVDSVPEGKEVTKYYQQKLVEGQYQEVRQHFVKIVSEDLRLIDLVDFVVVYLPKDAKTVGTIHEIIESNGQKKPTFIICPEGHAHIPLWLWGVIHYEYFFSSLADFVIYIKELNLGLKKLPDRFKLLRPEFR
jgi:hypothetical protein